MDFEYIIADPTGNITVLITSPYTDSSRQIMISESFERVPSCEQVGFIMPVSNKVIKLEMMGYEFCGNATLSAAAYHAGMQGLGSGCESVITVESSGADKPLDVKVMRLPSQDSGSIYGAPGFEGTVSMPVPAVSSFRGWPLVQFEGISHLIVPFEAFSDEDAEQSVKVFARELEVPALGMMLCPADTDDISIRPLVYVPGSDTLIWEHGCATGSTAVGFYRYHTRGITHTQIKQPGGIIRVDIAGGQPLLTGNVQFRPGK